RRLIESQSRSSCAGLDSATSLPGVGRKHAAFTKLSSVSSVDRALLFLPDDQPEKLKIIRDIAPLMAPLRLGPVPRLSVRGLTDALVRLEHRVEIASTEAGGDGASSLGELRAQLADVLTALRAADPVETQARSGAYPTRLSAGF